MWDRLISELSQCQFFICLLTLVVSTDFYLLRRPSIVSILPFKNSKRVKNMKFWNLICWPNLTINFYLLIPPTHNSVDDELVDPPILKSWVKCIKNLWNRIFSICTTCDVPPRRPTVLKAPPRRSAVLKDPPPKRFLKFSSSHVVRYIKSQKTCLRPAVLKQPP